MRLATFGWSKHESIAFWLVWPHLYSNRSEKRRSYGRSSELKQSPFIITKNNEGENDLLNSEFWIDWPWTFVTIPKYRRQLCLGNTMHWYCLKVWLLLLARATNSNARILRLITRPWDTRIIRHLSFFCEFDHSKVNDKFCGRIPSCLIINVRITSILSFVDAPFWRWRMFFVSNTSLWSSATGMLQTLQCALIKWDFYMILILSNFWFAILCIDA